MVKIKIHLKYIYIYIYIYIYKKKEMLKNKFFAIVMYMIFFIFY